MTTESIDINVSETETTDNPNSIMSAPPTISSQSASQLNTSVQQIITNIKQLQTTEMQLYTSLDDQNLDPTKRTNIINQINEIGQTRATLYNSLKNMASSYQQNVSTSQDTIQQQMFALDIVENELNEAKLRTQQLENEKYNKLRLVEINTYYGKRFDAHKEIVKIIVYVCIFMLITIILGKKEILPRNIYIVLNGMIIVIGIIVIGKKMIDLSNRDNMNFDEYDWYFDKTKAPSDTTDSSSSNPWAMPTVACVGEMCCASNPGVTYDAVQNICVLNTSTTLDTSEMATDTTTTTTDTTSSTSATTESFTNPFIRQKW
jgi:hypothetical protein